MPLGPADRIGRAFIDAFNRRDADGLIGLSHPEIEFYPTSLVGAKRVYHGHQGLRRWVADLAGAQVQHQVRVREVRALDERRLLVLSEVLLEDEVVSPSAMVATLVQEKIIEARAYLTDEDLLGRLGLLS